MLRQRRARTLSRAFGMFRNSQAKDQLLLKATGQPTVSYSLRGCTAYTSQYCEHFIKLKLEQLSPHLYTS